MKKTKRDIQDFSGAIITAGIGTAIGAGVTARSPLAAPMMGGFTAMGGMMAPMGTVMMGGNILRMTEESFGKKKKRRSKHGF